MAETWSFQLDRLDVIDADEDDFWSDGDEPYVIAIGFRSRALTPGSTSTQWSGVLDEDWADGIDDGGSAAIPASMGRVVFDNVQRPTARQIIAGQRPEVLGVLLIVMESDATPFDAIRAKTNDIKGVIEAQVRDLVENGNIDPADPAASIQRAIDAARDQLTPSVTEALALWLSSFGDPDDIVGTAAFVFAAVDGSAGGAVPLPLLDPRPVEVELGSNGVRYSLKGRIAVQRWSGFELSPGGSASAETAVAAVSRIPNSMELFHVAPNGSVQDRFWYDGQQWAGFELSGPGSASAAGGIAAVSRIPNSMEVFWVAPNGSVQDRFWYDGAQWGGFELSGPGSASAGGGIAAVSRIAGSMEVWFPGPNGSLQDRFWYAA